MERKWPMKSMLDSISGVEALQILRSLCSSDAELCRRIESEAERLLRNVDPQDVANDVIFDLESIDVEELWARSGETRHGYSSPDEMAVEMVEEALKPYEDKIQEYSNIGMAEGAKRYCMGVLKGIYEFEHQSKTEFKDWATDIPGECFGGILEEWQRSCAREPDVKEMNAFISKECPKWAE